MPSQVLLVDDDRFILNHLARLLGEQSCRCTCAISADDAWLALERERFDLMLLDIGLPDMDGLTFCRRVRTKHRFPIIMLTARDATSDKVVGLELGADDYIVKPFDPGELIARVRAHLRRVQEYESDGGKPAILHAGRLSLDLAKRVATRDGTPLALTPIEFELLHTLLRNRERALSHDWLYTNVWGWESEVGGQTLPVTIRRLRMKVEPDPAAPTYIQTVRGFGYKLVVPVD
jgi:DNA-binding response OmpR family regulator